MRTQIMQALAEMAVAALVAGGVISLLRLIEECLLTPQPLTAALLIRTEDELRNLDLLLAEADRHSLRTRGHPPLVVMDVRLATETREGKPCPDERAREALRRYRARLYLVDTSEPTGGDGGSA